MHINIQHANYVNCTLHIVRDRHCIARIYSNFNFSICATVENCHLIKWYHCATCILHVLSECGIYKLLCRFFRVRHNNLNMNYIRCCVYFDELNFNLGCVLLLQSAFYFQNKTLTVPY